MVQEIEQANNTTNEAMEAIVNNYRCICTIDVSTFDGKRAIVNARNTAPSLASLGDKPFTVTGVYVTPGIQSQTGQKCVNVYLFAKDGKTYFSQSEGIYRSVLDIFDMFPDFNAPDGLTVVVKQTTLGGGRTLKSLEIK
jgi:hypothetical protein